MDGVALHEGPVPGLAGEVAAAHGRWYAANAGFGPRFEAVVAGIVAEVCDRAADGDLILSARAGDRLAGFLILDLHDPAAPGPGWAHLRTFIVARPGEGLGGRMMARAMARADALGAACWLDTFAGLDAARRLYDRHGFRVVREGAAESWGTRVLEQRMERPARGAT